MDPDLLSRIDPEIIALVQRIPPIDLGDIDSERRTLTSRLTVRPDQDAVTVEDRLIPGPVGAPEVTIRLYLPRQAEQDVSLPCFIWIHGGGFVMGSVDQDDGFLEAIVTKLGCVAVSIEWRQAPENPFPAAQDDCFAAAAWVFSHARELRVDPSRVALGGGSCGGGLAASVALRLRDEGGARPCLQMLLYPMLDDRSDTPSSRTLTDSPTWNREANVIAWRSYLGPQAAGDDVSPYAAPARADDLSGLPPAFIAVGDADLLLDEDITYAQRLLQAGVPAELHVYPGMIHGFNAPVFDSARRRQFIRDRDTALRIAFGLHTPDRSATDEPDSAVLR